MGKFNIAYFAFDQFIPSKHAGFVHTMSIVKALKEIGNDVTLYGIPNGLNLFNIFKWKGNYDGIPINYTRFVVSFKLKYRLFSWLSKISYHKVLNMIKEQNPDIIHERFHVPNLHSIRIWEELKIPKVLEVNSLYVEEGVYKGKAKEIALKQREKLFEQAEAIITQTETLKKMISKLTSKPIYVIPNGVDTSKFRPDLYCEDLKEKLGLNDKVVVTFVGSFKKWHGVDQIPKIAKKFEDKNVVFLLIGFGELFKQVERMKTDNMILLGAKPHNDIPKYLALSDILIAPFDHEYFKGYGFWWNPVKLFEYMASGKPVVSYDYEEIRKIVRDAGLLAKPGDLEDFVRKLEYLIKDEGLREKMGKRAREIAEREYDWKIRAEQTIEVYEKVLKENN
ncbi:MAG: hypothetical protein PWP22_824 [Thermoanaerobacter sp.]|nr:hypothetical protein [Thermoanaerobacter sp.]